MAAYFETQDGFCSIAVVIPCYNAERFIRQTIQSAIDQNYPDLEIVVVDDGSTDGSVEIVKSFGDRVTLEIGENRGACRARNRGTALTGAEYVLYLDADDYLHGNYLQQLAAAAQGAPDVIIGAVYYLRGGDLSETKTYAAHESAHAFLCSYLKRFLQTSGFLWRRAFIERHGGWQEDLPVYQDIELAIRMLLTSPNIAYPEFDNAYAVYRHHSASPRISYVIDRNKSAAKISILKTYKEELQNLNIPELRSILANRFYEFAAEAFALGHQDIGRMAVIEAKSLGLRTFLNGVKIGDILTAAIGLEWKIRLMAFS